MEQISFYINNNSLDEAFINDVQCLKKQKTHPDFLVSCLISTVVLRTNETIAVYRSKVAFFKRAWQKVKVLSRP